MLFLLVIHLDNICLIIFGNPFQYPIRRLIATSCEVSKPRDWSFKLSPGFKISQAHRQHCDRCACQISERSCNSKYKSRGFEILWDPTIRRLSDTETGPASTKICDIHIPVNLRLGNRQHMNARLFTPSVNNYISSYIRLMVVRHTDWLKNSRRPDSCKMLTHWPLGDFNE